MGSGNVVAKKYSSNTLVVHWTLGSSLRFAWDEGENKWRCVSSYKLISCNADPALKVLEFTAAPIPDRCYTPEEAKSLAQRPSRWKKSINDPSIDIDDLVLEVMRSRGVKVECLY